MPEALERERVLGLVDDDLAGERTKRVDAHRAVDRQGTRLLERLDGRDGPGRVDAARAAVQVPLPLEQLLQVGHVLADRATAQGGVAQMLGRVDDEPNVLLGAVSGQVVHLHRQGVAALRQGLCGTDAGLHAEAVEPDRRIGRSRVGDADLEHGPARVDDVGEADRNVRGRGVDLDLEVRGAPVPGGVGRRHGDRDRAVGDGEREREAAVARRGRVRRRHVGRGGHSCAGLRVAGEIERVGPHPS